MPVAQTEEGLVMIIRYTDDVRRLIAMNDEMIHAKDLAPVLGMNPGVMIKKAKEGTWDRNICNYIVSGRCVKFFRIDFLRKGGWIS